MRLILFFFLFSFALSAQNNIIKTVGISYTNGTPTYTPAKAGSALALDTAAWRYYTWNGSSWLSDGFRVQTISGCSAPAYTPTKYQSHLVINACTVMQGGPELYYWTGSAWLQINEGQTYTAGTGINITSGVISATSTGGPDSTFRNIDGTYTSKRTTGNVYRNGTTGFGTTDTTGIINAFTPEISTRPKLYLNGDGPTAIQIARDTGTTIGTDFYISRVLGQSGPGGGRNNQVISMGWNMIGGALVDPTKPGVRWGIEERYRNSSDDPFQCEPHPVEIKYPDGDNRRPLSGIFSMDQTNKKGSWLFTSDEVAFYDYKTNTSKAVWGFAENGTAKGISFYDTARVAFYTNNTPVLQQKGTGSVFYEIMRINASNQAELSPQGIPLYTTSNNFSFQNGMTFQPNSGQGVAIGSSGNAAGQLEVFSLFPLWMKNSSNTSGFSYVLNGSLELRDMSSNAAIITIENNAPADVLWFKANGGLGMGGSPVNSAKLEVISTTQGFLPPRMTQAQRDAISSPATALTLYCTDCTATDTSTGVMQTYNGTTWKNNW